MKKLLLGLLLLTGFIAKAQVYNNEWIDYSKIYYKFKVGKTGLYRIPQSVLASAGLGSTSAEYFQLWRNGKQVPIYTSIANGALSASDYIEFWGQMNDGKPDRELYRNPVWQLNDKWSLETDTAAYFLTVNTDVASNLRLQSTANNVAGTSLPVDAYFMYTAGQYFKDKINPGYAVDVTKYMYSSSYDRGEGWSSNDLVTTFSNCVPTYGKSAIVFSNLNAYKGTAPAPKFKIAVSGNQLPSHRRYFTKINSDSIISNSVDFFNYTVDSTNFSINTLNGTLDTVTVFNYTSASGTDCPVNDRMVIHQYEITYPRNFNFNGQSSFEFTLSPNAAGNYLQITNFFSGSSTPVLYDLTNGKRYLADLSSAPILKFVLEPSLVSRSLVLVNEDAGNVNLITSLQERNFINYTDASNQGDYLIITDPILFAGDNGTNPINDYKSYRSSAAGGSYDAKIYLVSEITDQFGFGIKKNPAAIRDFIRYARNKFTVAPREVFLVGRGMTYLQQRTYESYPDVDKLNLVPTFGNPASDILLAADPGSSQPATPIGRLSVISASEVAAYLKKVKDFEQAQATQSPLIKDKAWMKNVMHIVGASDQALDSVLSQYLNDCKNIIAGPLYGADVFTFNKSTTDAVSQLSDNTVEYLINNGLSMITYFGHSSASTLEFNLDHPQNYNNYGKYPLFVALGCDVGDFFGYSTLRFQTKATLSENYVLSPDRGTIGLIGSTHWGIPYYLDIWAERAYQEIGSKNYGKTIGEILKETAADVFRYTTQEDFYARATVEESLYHGDPAVRLNPHEKPDYVVEDSLVKINPSFVSIANSSFRVTANFLNIGRSPDSSIIVEVKRLLPNQSDAEIIRRDTIPGIRYSSSMVVDVPVDPIKDKGLNKIIVTVDPDNKVDELFENNNSVTKDVMIYEDEAKPIYPYNYAIVNKQNIKLVASTANPFADEKQYKMELDTTELFTSPLKIVKTVTSKGGILEFDPGILFMDSTVYYWRVAESDSSNWSTASFVYLANSDFGFNQSHYFQHLKSGVDRIFLDSASRTWVSKPLTNNLYIRNGVWTLATGQEGDLVVNVNYDSYIRNTCNYGIIFNVFDKNTFKPWRNALVNGQGLYNSLPPNCGESRMYNFEFSNDTAGRRKAMEFLRYAVPDGSYVVIRNQPSPDAPQNQYVNQWINDETIYGQNNSLYNELKSNGVNIIDSFYRLRTFAAVYKKSSPQFTPAQVASNDQYDVLILSVNCLSSDSLSLITSPQFGPAKQWKQIRWAGSGEAGDRTSFNIIGVKANGATDSLITNIDGALGAYNISGVDATVYPYLKLQMKNIDTVNFTPYQLKYWQLTGNPAPEGAVSPNIYFEMKDTVEVGEPLVFKIAFKNVSDGVFSDSIKVKAIVTDRNNVTHMLPTWKQRPLLLNPDTLYVTFPIDTRSLTGQNTMFIEVNPDNDQAEQYHFNNFFYRTFYVRGDTLNPLLDVTFDNVHILNHDIVSSKPNILIKLKDEAKWYPMDDPSSMKIQVRYPDGSLHPYNFNTDTLQFTPAGSQVPITNNTATAVFKPYFSEDGEYELIVTGKDMSQNSAGPMEYRVAFEVINKPMISNMLNYPNPFTTSTAFVFTLTGSEVPQNIRIQILTVTGKIVREITKDELGPLHIGRNITEFKWDGTDQYGQKLANGVYLYRVITNLNGKSLDKYTSKEDNTDKFFNKGYGKMYLMR